MASDFILDSTKKALGLSPSYDVFDPEIIMYINGVFSTLHQLGIGPEEGFAIQGDGETWNAFLGDDPRLASVMTYVYLKVRLIFDPPASSFAIAAFEKQCQELEWRLNVYREGRLSETTVVSDV